MPLCEILLYSMTMSPATRASRATLLRMKCETVPLRFCSGVCVGWRRRMDCVRTRRPPVFRRGWAEKRISGLRKTLAQTEAVRRRMPA